MQNPFTSQSPAIRRTATAGVLVATAGMIVWMFNDLADDKYESSPQSTISVGGGPIDALRNALD